MFLKCSACSKAVSIRVDRPPCNDSETDGMRRAGLQRARGRAGQHGARRVRMGGGKLKSNEDVIIFISLFGCVYRFCDRCLL